MSDINSESEKSDSEKPKKIEPSFEPSGLLAIETNERNGIIIKYTIPPESRMPNQKWRLYMFKSQDGKSTTPDKVFHLSDREFYLIGKEPRVCDLTLLHPSISKQHAVIQFRLRGTEILPYLIDLNSTNGTLLNDERIEPSRYYQLLDKDCIKFAYSTREYILLHSD